MQAAAQVLQPQTLLSEILSENQVARELNVHVKTLRRWHSEHVGPPRVKIGKQIYYRRAAVLCWLEKNQAR